MKPKHALSSSLLCTFALASCTGAQKEKPNIVFILADDMGYGDVSYLDARSKIKTPFIDHLATESVIFTDAHSGSSVSTPTRYGILTGRYSWRTNLKKNTLDGYSKPMIDPDRSTMASMLKAKGYTTAGIGKWHLGWTWENIEKGRDSVDFSQIVSDGPTTRGFDYFYGIAASLDMSPYVYLENDKVTALPDRRTVNTGEYSWWREGPTGSDFVHEEVLPNIIGRACDYISEKAPSEQPYFLYLALPAPHTPILPSEEFRGKSGIGEYGDFVMMVDAMIGRVLQAITESGEEENTLVVFTTDNGCAPAAGFEMLVAQGHYPNSIYRGYKSDLFDGGNRVPCMVRWPALFPPHTIDQTVCLTDFYATFAQLVGHEMTDAEGEDSYSLLPALLGKEDANTPIREATVHHSIDGRFAIRKGDWKLLLYPGSGGWSKPRASDTLTMKELPAVQLYNMKEDPSETNNLQAEHPEIVKELRDLMIQYIDQGRSTPGQAQPNYNGNNRWKMVKDFIR